MIRETFSHPVREITIPHSRGPPPTIHLLLLRQQIPQREIVHDILHILDPVLEPVAPTAQTVVLEVEDLEARMQVLDELVDQQRALVVAECDSVASEAGLQMSLVVVLNSGVMVTYQLFDERDEGLQILFDSEVELIAVF